MKRQFSFLIRWSIFAVTLLFLAKTLLNNWQAVSRLHLQDQAWLCSGVALGVALLAHLWSAFVWGWILEALQNPVPKRWTLVVFLKMPRLGISLAVSGTSMAAFWLPGAGELLWNQQP